MSTRQDLQEALEIAAAGKVRATIERQPLQAINSVFERLRRGDMQGRVVLKI